MTAIGIHDYNNVQAKSKKKHYKQVQSFVFFPFLNKFNIEYSEKEIERLRKNISAIIKFDFDQIVVLLLNSDFSYIYIRSSVFAELTFVLVPLKRNKIQR